MPVDKTYIGQTIEKAHAMLVLVNFMSSDD